MDDRFGALGACHCIEFDPFATTVVASSSRGALFQLYDAFAKPPPSEGQGCLEHFESSFACNDPAKYSTAASRSYLDRFAILCFEVPSLVKLTVVWSFVLLHLHSVDGFLGFDPDLH